MKNVRLNEWGNINEFVYRIPFGNTNTTQKREAKKKILQPFRLLLIFYFGCLCANVNRLIRISL